MRKILSAFLAVFILIGAAVISAFAADLPFTDVKKGAWYESAVETVYAESIMEGKSEGRFAPKDSMTRAELVTVLCRLSGDEAEGKGDTLSFKDTKKTAWYADSVAWAAENGIVSGYEDNSFKPDTPVLRCELAKMIVTFLEHMEITEKGTPLVDSFTDKDSFPKWAAEYIEKLRETGLMGGDDAGCFKPKSDASRAEIAVVITRLLPMIEKEDEAEHPVTDTETEPPEAEVDEFVKWSPAVVIKKAEKQEPFDTVGNLYMKQINWRLYVPDDYDPEKKYPVFLFLHGSGETGMDNSAQLNRLVLYLYNQPNSSIRDAICIYPQTPGGWHADTLHALMEHVASLYSTDADRYYVMGLSMGGHGTWDIISRYPDYFAAAVPICGAGDTTSAPSLAHMPIYIVHGAKDDVVSVGCSRNMYKALKAAGSTSVVYDEIPDYGHNAWDYVSAHEEILVWMFEQSRADKLQ